MDDIKEAWSVDEEYFNYHNLCDLIDSHDELEVGQVVHYGDAEYPEWNHLIDADDIIETMGERAYEYCGEFYDDYPQVSYVAVTELNMFLKEWIAKYCPPTFYTVKNVKEYTITEEDLNN